MKTLLVAYYSLFAPDVARLADPDFAVREAAQARLEAALPWSLPAAARAGAETADAEARARCRRVVEWGHRRGLAGRLAAGKGGTQE